MFAVPTVPTVPGLPTVTGVPGVPGVPAVTRVLAWIEENLGIDAGKGGLADAVLRHATERCALLRVSPATYVAMVASDPVEQEGLVRTVSVGHTWFMRDREQLELVVGRFVGRASGSPIRIWVAGCATGEEAYSLVLLANARGVPVRVLATDLNERSLAIAKRARYGAWTARGLTAAERALLAAPSGLFEIPESVKAAVTFERHNLVDAPPSVPGGFDAIVCRNVLLYFTKPRALAALRRMRGALSVGGTLVIAASDVLADGTTSDPPPGNSLFAPPPPAACAEAPEPVAEPPTPYPPHTVSADGEAALAEADAALDVGDVDGACERLRAILAKDPLSTEAYLLLGIACDGAGNTFAAMAAFRSALLLDPTLFMADVYLGLAHDRLGATEDAQRCFVRAVASAEAKRPASKLGPTMTKRIDEGRAQLLDVARARLDAGRVGRRA